MEVSFFQSRIRGFARWDLKFFIPFFTRRFTQQELKDCKSQMTDLTNQWYQAVRISPLESDDDATTVSSMQMQNNDNPFSENANEPHDIKPKERPSHSTILNI
jgi:sodium/hydrogen exchanger 8